MNSAGRVRPGALSLVAGRSPGGSPPRGSSRGASGGCPGPAPAGDLARPGALPLAGCPVERDQDQPTGRRAVDQLREGLREGVPVQRRPGTLLALGRCRWPVQVTTAAKPTPGPRTSHGGIVTGRAYPDHEQRRPGSPWGSVARCWLVTRWKPSPWIFARGFGRGSRSSADRGPCSPWGSAAGRWPGVPWSGARINRPGSGRVSSAARAFGRVSGPTPAGFALDRCRWPGVPWSGARINRAGSGRLTSAARVFGRVSGPAPAGFALGLCSAGRSPGGSPLRGAVPGSTGRAPGGCPAPRGPSGGCQVQRRPGSPSIAAAGRVSRGAVRGSTGRAPAG